MNRLSPGRLAVKVHAVAAFAMVLTLGLSSMGLVAAERIDADTYPRLVRLDGGVVSIHHPSITQWTDFRNVSGQSALEIRPDGSERSWLATVDFTVETEVDLDARVVHLKERREPRLSFRDGNAPESARLLAEQALGSGSDRVALDFLLRSLPGDFEIPQKAQPPAQLNFDPPRVVVSEEETRLMLVDGPPSYVEIEGTDLEFVVNTDWTVFRDPRSSRWFIIDDSHWLENSLFASGDWLATTDLPDDFRSLQLNSDWPEVQKAMPPRKPADKPLPILISYEPTELIVMDGPPRWEAIADSGIRFASNSRSDLFLLGEHYYLLVSGRWFTTKDLGRQWSSVRQLPSAFSQIPANHPRAYVRAAIPGTEEARLAAIEAAIPRIAYVRLNEPNDLLVPYVGEPSFVEIQGTALRRAENTPYQVIWHNNFYYLCHEGAWYASRDPRGPWQAATEIPEAIYDIPPTDPAYNVTFVKVEAFDDSSDRVAYYSTSGYYGTYWTGSSLVYGTGWYHPGYYNRYAYWRYPYSWGYRGAYWGPWGPYHPYGWGYPYPYHYSTTVEVNKPDKDWQWDLEGNKRTVYDYGPRNFVGSGTYNMGDSKMFTPKSDDPATGHSASNAGEDDLYTDPNGGVYRQRNGGWQFWGDRGWVTLTPDQVELVTPHLDKQQLIRQSAYRDYDRFREQ